MNICITAHFEYPAHDTDFVIFPSVKEYMPEWEAKDYLEKAVDYARRHQVYLLTPMFSAADHLSTCLLSPEGKIAGLTQSCNLTTALRTRFEKATQKFAIDTKFGRTMIFNDIDIYNPELVAAAAETECDFIIATQYIQDIDFSKELIFFGAWRAAQQLNRYVIHASNQGCCIAAPCSWSTDRSMSGFEAQFTEEIPFYHSLDLSRTKKA